MNNQKLKNLLKDPNTNWRYLLIVVILAFLVGGGILGYCYWWLPEQEVEIPEIETPEKKPKDETADWRAYRNEEYGFEVKYPLDFKVDESKDKEIIFESKIWEGYKAHHPYIKITIYETDILVLEWLDKDKIFGPLFHDPEGKIYVYSGRAGESQKEPVEYITIDDVEAVEFYWWGVSGGGDNILIKNKNKPNLLYHIQRHLAGSLSDPEKTVPREVFNQILSTFSFLE